MYGVIVIQSVATLLAVVASSVIIGAHGGVSAAIGGLACVVPNLLFAWGLRMAAGRQGTSFRFTLVVGELFKLMLVTGLLVVVAKRYGDLHWPSLLIGLALASQAVFWVFWKKN